MNLQKDLPIRNKEYLKWVSTLDCSVCGAPADDPHHLIGIGYGGTGTKACDLYSMPVCRGCHTAIHQTPKSQLEQWMYIAKTLRTAVKQGVLVFSGDYPK